MTLDPQEKFLFEDANEVIEHYQRIIERDPHNPMAYYAIGALLINKSEPDYKGAIKYFEKAVYYYPTYRQAHFNLGKAYLHEKMIPQARSQVEVLKKIGSKEYAKMLEEEIKKVTS